MKITVDQEKCCGAGLCALTVPEVFAQRDEDRIVMLLEPAPAVPYHGVVREAVTACPTGAIELNEEAPTSGSPSDDERRIA